MKKTSVVVLLMFLSAAYVRGQKMKQEKRSDMRPSEGYITTGDGVRLFFQKLGNGHKAVIIPNAIYMFDDFRRLADDRTLIFYDLRNRGHSDQVTDASKLRGGVRHDVDDLEAVRQHFGINKVDVIGHSYLGLMVILYAMKHPLHVNRVVQIGPMQPNPNKQYPDHLTGADATLLEVSTKLAQIQQERESENPKEFCRKWWSIARAIYVANPADADKISSWGFCDLPTELNMMKHYSENIHPSIQSLNLKAEEVVKVKSPVLTVHGKRDRNAPYGGAREWALILPRARLVTIENAAHVPWVEAPEKVFGSIKVFLDGMWPEAAEKVKSLDPQDEAVR